MNLISKIIFFFIFFTLYNNAIGQSFYYLDDDNKKIGVMDMANGCTPKPLYKLDTFSNDLALHPDGSLYACGGQGQIYKVDKITGKFTHIATLPAGSYINSLTCDNKGILYAAGISLFTYDTNTGISEIKGDFPSDIASAGDLTFRKGKLYLASDPNKVVEVDIDNPMNSKILFEGPPDFYMNGIVTFPYDCDSTITYCTGIFGGSQIKHVGIVDFENKKINLLCEIPMYIIGAASEQEFISSDCSLALDLDANNSSGAKNNDYKNTICTPHESSIADLDATISSKKVLDSMVVRLMSGVLDIGKEEIVLPNPSNDLIVQTTNNNGLIRLISKSGSQNSHFETALKKIIYQNKAPNPSVGERVIQVTSYTNKAQSRDTALARLFVGSTYSAGRDSSFALCADAKAISFVPLGNTAQTGTWLPATKQLGSFNPALDQAGAYQYIVSNTACPNDTATFKITLFSLPTPQIVGDSLLCEGETATLSTKPTTFSSYKWSDKNNTASIKVNTANSYTVTVTDIHGCSATTTTTVSEDKGTSFDLGNDLEINEGDSVLLQPIDLNPNKVNTAFWLPNTHLMPNATTLEVYAKPLQSTLYTLKISNLQGCISEDSIWVKVKQRSRNIFAPNVFSPNDDSVNNIFTIFAGNFVSTIQILRVYSRWGELVFEKENFPPNDPNQGWDGTYRSRPAGSDVYVFYAVLLLNDGTTKTIQGDLTLLR